MERTFCLAVIIGIIVTGVVGYVWNVSDRWNDKK